VSPLSALLLLTAVGQPVEEAPPRSDSVTISSRIETIAYSTDSLVFFPETGDLILIGQTRMDYRDMTLLSDTVEYDAGREIFTASGESELIDQGESITGTRMVYSLSSRKGRIIGAESQYEFGFYSGESITRVGPNEFNIVNARFTTCERDTSDYYFFSPEMKVFPDDKAVARSVSLFVEDTPVFYFPFWVFPIRRGRTEGFTIPKFGQTSADGRYLRDLGYYFFFSDYADVYIHGDIMEKTRFMAGISERHRIRYLCNGGMELEWRREFRNSRDRWMAFGQHLHDFPDGTSVRLRGEFLSDRSYLEQTQQTPEDRMSSELRSWVSLSRYFGRLSVQATMDRTSYLSTNPDSLPNEVLSDQELPDIRLSLPSSPLFTTPRDPTQMRPWHSLYWNASAHYLSRDQRMEEARATNSALRLSSSLTGSNRVWGWLAFAPALHGTGTVYDRDRLGDTFPWWINGSASLTLSTDVYGIFSTGLMGLEAFRHTITPSATLSWSPDTYIGENGVAPSDSASELFYSFADFGLPAGGSILSLSLQNTLEGKRQTSTGIQRFDMASLGLATSIDLEAVEEPFSPLTATLDLTPVQVFGVRAAGSWDLYEERLSAFSVTSSLNLSGYDRTLLPDSGSILTGMPLRVSLSHYYRLGLLETDEISKFRLSTTLNLTPGWSVEYSAYYDALGESFISQSYTLRRDLHCWEAIFVRQISDVDSGFYFRINIKDLPDIKLEQHVTDF
jgi:lipopolysaccharide assembly outer membrane protein LptD (OstA)